jgi:hypothetical protein
MPSVIATDSTRRSWINSNISRAMRGSARISPSFTFQSRNSSTSAFSDRRNWPTPQSLPGSLAQALEKSIFHHIASLSEASVKKETRASARARCTAGSHWCGAANCRDVPNSGLMQLDISIAVWPGHNRSDNDVPNAKVCSFIKSR